jgi:hypothetical protein
MLEYKFLYPDDFNPIVERSKDTLFMWFFEQRDSVGVVFGLDTLDFNTKPFDSLFYNKTLSMVDFNAAKTILAPFDSLQVNFISPLSKIDSTLIRLTNKPAQIEEKPNNLGQKDSIQINKKGLSAGKRKVDSRSNTTDSLEILQDTAIQTQGIDTSLNDVKVVIKDSLVIDSLEMERDSLVIDSSTVRLDTVLIDYDFSFNTKFRKLNINSKWLEAYEYRLELLPGAITDIYGRQNDSLLIDFKTASLDEFGNISINLSGLDSAQQYVVLLKLNDETIKKTIVPDSTLKRIDHKRLRVNTYSIELIKDDDGNGEWTTGDYWKKRQPEETKTFQLEKLRENWDLEAVVFWNENTTIIQDSLVIGVDTSLVKPPPSGINKRKQVPRSGRPNRKGRNDPDPKGKND